MPEQEREDPGSRPIAGRFWVEDVLGRGGMGRVYRVRDARTGRRVALKRGYSRDGRKAERRQALLEREYHTLAQLAHPRIIEVYDYGVDEQGPYYTMELLDGADLDKRGKLPWREACALLCDVASSLAILHSRGLLHRDVSARNVRCTADGRAKLMDFGAMACMGVAKEVVGTPPFVAPEAMQMQALDARADLFSLGALAYYMFCGRHAFPARRFSDLRDAWRSPPPSPSRLTPELPAPLVTLVLQLLSLDRAARPQSAAEVMERLCAAAGLPMGERAEVSRAYLSTPVLVGREGALLAVRKRMLSLVRGDGGTLLIEGVTGSGRSRVLDACVLEGKLLGATVLRVDASDSASGDFGVVREIGAQLLDLMPDEAVEASRLSRHVLGYAIEGLRGDVGRSSSAAPERSLLLRELRDFVLSLSRGQRLLLVVDDADRIDEPSLALLAALAHKTERHSIMIALSATRETGRVETPSMRLLREVATPVVLEPLTAEQIEALVRSVFGDVANLQLVAGRIHELSHGSPRAAMELAQHLVDRGLARYEAGSWLLPAELDDSDLPRSLGDSLARRLAVLSADARELCDVLSLADGDPLALADYPVLTGHGDAGRVFCALDELVAARVLVADAEHYRFSQRGFLSALHEQIPESRSQAMHAAIADLLGRRAVDALRVVHHMLRGGREREGVELLFKLDGQLLLPPLELSERALETALRLEMPARMCNELRHAILAKAPMVMAVETFQRQVRPVLDRLERDSGLLFWREAVELPAAERLAAALGRAQAAYEATAVDERVYAPVEAIRELARFSANACSIGMQLYDLEFLEALPSLEPLVSLSPALAVVARMVEACKETLRGRTQSAVQGYEQVLKRLAEPDRAGFDEVYYRGIRHGIHYLLGLLKASMGDLTAEVHAQLLEADREHRVNAWRLRVCLRLNQGNTDEARACQRRAELLQLQEGAQQRYIGASAAFELLANVATCDLLGVKRALDGVAAMAEHYPGWRPTLLFGQSQYRFLQGDLEGALDTLLPALELAQPHRHPYFCLVAAAHVDVLRELGRLDEALEHGQRYLEICSAQELSAERWVQQAVAKALGRAGRHAEAVALIDEAIAQSQRAGIGGLSLGLLFEARAQIAIWMGDREGFERLAERCAREYKQGKNPALSAKFARLMDEARERDVELLGGANEASALLAMPESDTGYETLQSRMLECVDEFDRARCALSMLLQRMDSYAGHLYGAQPDGQLRVLASLPEIEPSAELGSWLEASLEAELESGASVTTGAGDDESGADEVAARYTDAQGRNFEPVFLSAKDHNGERIAGVLALQIVPGPRCVPPKELIAEIAAQLLQHGDVPGVTLA
ncbi:MAG: protein kinase [Polyangiales bacterium]